jgi:hypothetical protein
MNSLLPIYALVHVLRNNMYIWRSTLDFPNKIKKERNSRVGKIGAIYILVANFRNRALLAHELKFLFIQT